MSYKPTALLIACYDPYKNGNEKTFIENAIAGLAVRGIRVDVEVNPFMNRPVEKVIIVFVTEHLFRNAWAIKLINKALRLKYRVIPVIFDSQWGREFLEENGLGDIWPVSFINKTFEEGMRKLTEPFIGQ